MLSGSSIDRRLMHRINLYPHAHLRKHIRWPVVVGLVAVSALGIWLLSSKAIAADLTPVSSLEAQRTGDVSSADILQPMQSAASLSYSHTDAPLTMPDADNAAESKVGKLSVNFGLGLTSFMQLDLGIKGVHTEYSATSINEENNNVSKHQKNEFSGVSLMTKFRLLNNDAVKIAIAPFLESASGPGADESFARSGKGKAGWMALFTYRAAKLLELNLDGGYRYRAREQFETISVRNEAFYSASLEVMMGQMFAIFANGEGRALKISDEVDYVNSGKRDYKSVNTTGASGGVIFKVGGSRITAFGGSSLGNETLGQGKTKFGLSVAYIFSGKKNTAPAPRMETIDGKSEKTEASKQPPKDLGPNAVLDPYGNVVDIEQDIANLPAGGEEDDFTLVQERIKKEDHAKGPSDDQIVEAELEKIKEADAKKQAEEDAKQKLEEAARRKNLRSQIEKDAAEEARLRKDILENDKFPEITDEDASWPGLE